MVEPRDDNPNDNRNDERDATRAYRGLPREEPPAPLDDAIRAAARRHAKARPAPLVAPTGRRRWYFPVAAAAVIVLAVAVTSQVERDQVEPAPSAAPEAKIQVQKERGREKDGAPQAGGAAKPERRSQPPAESSVSREEFGRDRLSREEAPRPQAAAPAPAPANRALMKAVSPESELERIAGLRRQGKDEEADRALAEFRKRYPDYRFSPEMLEKVEKK